ncbi:PIN domain-containing protein [Streptomyces doebereineriae]|uniref:PIN domain-containing protein n=1 Tax=Streptomyces doebereineriae TaxID=3075528 RepID=A0ABU2VSD9_9ACTN|nr:PIN domain-containing protein [Streptomyces sp. DSM 41640]MDT0488170.1 PIN domain-containing protein [Streptomyces sp. DSM 41640]
MDTSILRSFNPQSSSADLLRAIRATGAARVAAPSMVLTELCAQQAIKYREQHERAAEALEALRATTPWPVDLSLEPCEEDAFREHWRNKWLAVVEEVPTSAESMLQGFFRESNNLPPCRMVKGNIKIGARDTAIWLSAVEYAREHPDETVYFVSSNTNDFGNRSPYPSPMSEDLVGLEDRFVHLTSMDDVAARFAEPATIDEESAVAMLGNPLFTDEVARVSREALAEASSRPFGSFSCTVVSDLGGEHVIAHATGWTTTKAAFSSVENMQAYRIGDQVWCTATVQWLLGGVVLTNVQPPRVSAGACSWTTTVLFTPRGAESRITVLRAETPLPVSGEEFDALGLPEPVPSPVERAVTGLMEAAANAAVNRRPLQGIPRPYEGASLRKAITKQVRMGDTAAG